MLEKLADGRVVQDVGAALTPTAHGAADRAGRNSSGRVFLADGEAFTVTVTVGGKSVIAASGTAKAKAGKRCALLVRVRAEADVDEPEVTP